MKIEKTYNVPLSMFVLIAEDIKNCEIIEDIKGNKIYAIYGNITTEANSYNEIKNKFNKFKLALKEIK